MSGLNLTKPIIVIWIAATLMLTACAGPWNTAPVQLSEPQWSITSPEGWMHLNMQESEMLSKDGPYLEYILIQSRPLERGFRYTRQKLEPDMLPHEAAQVIADNMRSDPVIRQLQLLAIEPATVGGHAGFRLIYSYQDPYGVEIKTIYYGVILPNQFFNLRYTAAQRYYFEKELPAFNEVLNSLRLVMDLNRDSERIPRRLSERSRDTESLVRRGMRSLSRFIHAPSDAGAEHMIRAA